MGPPVRRFLSNCFDLLLSSLQLTFPVRVAASLGVEVLIATNACGSMNPAYNVGDFVIVSDHINLPGLGGLNPLMGLCDDRYLLTSLIDLDKFSKLQIFCFFIGGTNIVFLPGHRMGQASLRESLVSFIHSSTRANTAPPPPPGPVTVSFYHSGAVYKCTDYYYYYYYS